MKTSLRAMILILSFAAAAAEAKDGATLEPSTLEDEVWRTNAVPSPRASALAGGVAELDDVDALFLSPSGIGGILLREDCDEVGAATTLFPALVRKSRHEPEERPPNAAESPFDRDAMVWESDLSHPRTEDEKKEERSATREKRRVEDCLNGKHPIIRRVNPFALRASFDSEGRGLARSLAGKLSGSGKSSESGSSHAYEREVDLATQRDERDVQGTAAVVPALALGRFIIAPYASEVMLAQPSFDDLPVPSESDSQNRKLWLVAAKSTRGIALGSSVGLLGDTVSLGATLRWEDRHLATLVVPDSEVSSGRWRTSDFARQMISYSGFATDVGASWSPDALLSPRLAIAIRDLGETSYIAHDPVKVASEDSDLATSARGRKSATRVSIGASASRKFASGIRLLGTTDVDQIGTMNKSSAGTEVSIGRRGSRATAALRLGLSRDAAAFGAMVNLGFFSLEWTESMFQKPFRQTASAWERQTSIAFAVNLSDF